MRTTSPTGTRSKSRQARAFSLIELILVLALLVMVVSLIMPMLKKFFSGRDVDSEVKHFIAMEHYGQSRAVSEGIPMMLWIDPATGAYGLEQESGYTNGKDDKAADSKIENAVDPRVTIGVARSTAKTPLANSQTGRIIAGLAGGQKNKQQAIYFSPDGAVNPLRSVARVSFQSGDNPAVWVDALEAKISDAPRK